MNKMQRSNFRLAILGVLCGTSPILASDGFIVQPKLKQNLQAPQTVSQSAAGKGVPADSVSLANPIYQQPTQNTLGDGPSDANVGDISSARGVAPNASVWVPRGTIATDQIENSGSAPDSGAIVVAVEPIQAVQRLTNIDGPPEQTSRATLNPSVHSTTDQSPIAASADEFDASSHREHVAALISSKILGEATPVDESRSIAAVDSPPGWQAVGERLTQHLRACEKQLRHNATFSAREEAEQASVYLMRTLDLYNNDFKSEPDWRTALQALRESEDFTLAQHISVDTNMLKRIIDSHETQVLKGIETGRVSPLVAAQHYRQFAEQLLVRASQGHPWASEVFYCMGRTYQAQADSDQRASENLRWKAITFYRAAVSIAPGNALAANQLGFVLLQLDRPQDARQALLVSINSKLSSVALENLAEASRRLSDSTMQQWAIAQHAAFMEQHPARPDEPLVTELDPSTFIRISPRNIGPQPHMDSSSRVATRSVAGDATAHR